MSGEGGKGWWGDHKTKGGVGGDWLGVRKTSFSVWVVCVCVCKEGV